MYVHIYIYIYIYISSRIMSGRDTHESCDVDDPNISSNDCRPRR